MDARPHGRASRDSRIRVQSKRGAAMIRRLCLAALFATLALATQPLAAQGDLILPVKATGQNVTFFQNFVFREGSISFPGFVTGDLEIGGEGIQVVTRQIAVQVPRTVSRLVLVREN